VNENTVGDDEHRNFRERFWWIVASLCQFHVCVTFARSHKCFRYTLDAVHVSAPEFKMSSQADTLIDSLTRQGVALARAGDLPQALGYFRRCFALAPNGPEVLNNLGLTLCKLGAEEEGCAYLDRALAVWPGHVDALHNKGLYLQRKRRYAESVGLFVDALTQKPERADIVRACAFSHLMIGNMLTAASMYLRLAQLNPAKDDAEVRQYVIYLQVLLNEDQRFLAELDSGLETFEDAIMLYARSRVKVHRGQNDEALTVLEAATGKDAGLTSVAANDPCFDNLFLTSQRFRTLVPPVLDQDAVNRLEHLSARAADCHKKGKYKQAIEHSEKVLHEFGPRLGDRFVLARTWQNLAESHFRLAAFSEGVRCFEQLGRLAGATRGTNSFEVLNAVVASATAYDDAANYEGAAELYQSAIDIARRTLGSIPDLASYLTRLAIVNLRLGDYQQTKSLYEEALEVIRNEPRVRFEDLVRGLDNLARLYQKQGDYRNAETVAGQAVEIARQQLGPDSMNLADSLQSLAYFYLNLGQGGKVIPLLNETLAITERKYGPRSRESAAYLNDLALAVDAAGDHKRAEKLFEQVLRILRHTGDVETSKYAGTVSNLGSVYLRTGRYSRAERVLKEAIAIAPTGTGGIIQFNLAALYHRKGRFAEAEAMYLQAIEAHKTNRGEHHPDLVLLLAQLAQLYNDMDKSAKAMRALEDAIGRSEAVIDVLLAITSDVQRLAYLSRIQFCIELYVGVVLQRFPKSRACKGKAFDLILRRKGIGFEASALQREALLKRYASVAPTLRELRAVRNEIGTKSILGPAPGEEEFHSKMLAGLNGRRARLEEELAKEIPDLPSEDGAGRVTRTAVAKAMPEGSVLLEFVVLDTDQYRRRPRIWTGRHYVVFVLHADRPEQVTMIDLGSTSAIDRLIVAFRKAVMAMAPESAEKTIGARQRKLVFDPLQASLRKKRALILARDGNLLLLPFEILPAANGGRLLDHLEIGYIGAGRDVLRFRDKHDARTAGAALVVADPVAVAAVKTTTISRRCSDSSDDFGTGCPVAGVRLF
jgi:tetratricopeptide (TPR) repeat protein